MQAIEAQGLSKRYGSTIAVDDLSFVVQSGRVTGFVGPNGAGKSTTMRMILGLDAPDAGDVRVGGQALRGARNAAARGRRAAGRDAPCIRAGGLATTCAGSLRAIGCHGAASTRSSSSSA